MQGSWDHKSQYVALGKLASCRCTTLQWVALSAWLHFVRTGMYICAVEVAMAPKLCTLLGKIV